MGGRHRIRVLALATLVVLLLPILSAASFNLGVSPTKIVKGTYDPGDTFHAAFYLVSGTGEELDVSITVDTASIIAFERRFPEKAAAYSEQDCSDCFNLLQNGEMDEAGSDAPQGVQQWSRIAFLMELPEDIEPGHHMVMVSPVPRTSGGGGGVGVVSTARLPVVFEVAGEAERSMKIIGVQAGRHVDGRQELVASVHNTGTVTATAQVAFTVETLDGTRTIGGGSRKISPGRTVAFSGYVNDDLINGTFPVTASADYVTGNVTHATELTVQPVVTGAVAREQPREDRFPLLAAIVLLVLSSLVTYWVVRRG